MVTRSGEAAVLLGLLDGPVPPRSATSWSCNKVGGEPDCVPGVPLAGHTACGACGSAQALVAQLYCPLEGSPYHRTLHLLACPRATCFTSARGWRALRSQYLDPVHAIPAPALAPPQAAPLMSTKDWCDSADDWGDDGNEGRRDAAGATAGVVAVAAPPPQSVPPPDSPAPAPQLPQPSPLSPTNPGMELCPGMDGLSLGNGRAAAAAAAAARPQDRGDPAPWLVAYFLNAVCEEDCAEEEEDGEEAELTRHARALLSEYQLREGGAEGPAQQSWQGDGGGVGGAREEYEPTCARHGDRLFLKFMKRTARCPRQVLRYSWGGEPLYVSAPDHHLTAPPTPCPLCGAPRVFEMQLMPALVWQLRGAEGTDSVPEFGSVLVFTCSRSCWVEPGGLSAPREEEVRFQPDPDQGLL